MVVRYSTSIGEGETEGVSALTVARLFLYGQVARGSTLKTHVMHERVRACECFSHAYDAAHDANCMKLSTSLTALYVSQSSSRLIDRI